MVVKAQPSTSGSTFRLSPRQQDVLRLIEQFIRLYGLPPTRADLTRALELRNRQGIDQHLRALARKGRITLEPGIARGIRLRVPSSSATLSMPVSRPIPPPSISSPSMFSLPLYSRVAAGAPTFADSNIEEQIAIDGSLFRPHADFLLRVRGESMRDAGIQDRDVLAVHRTAEARNGQIVVARLGDEATVKYYRREGARLRLEPANPDFAPLQIDLRHESCQIEGVVVGLLRLGAPIHTFGRPHRP